MSDSPSAASAAHRPHQYVPDTWPAPMRLLAKVSHGLAVIEGAGIAVCLVAVILFATWQFLERNLTQHHIPFVSAPPWIDGVIRHAVFMLGFLGGAYAAYTGRHIRVDTITRMAGVRKRMALRVVTTLAALFVVTLFVVAAKGYYDVTLEESGEASQADQIFTPARGVMIILVGYTTIAFHFLIQILIDLGWLISKQTPPAEWVTDEAAH